MPGGRSRPAGSRLRRARGPAGPATFSLFLLPFCLRECARCSRPSFVSARRKNRGAETLVPSDKTANAVSPRSMPTSRPTAGKRCASAAGPVFAANDAKYRPAASLITVTLDGSPGSGRDHRTATSPIFGSRSRPSGKTLNRAMAVNRIACRRSLRDRNRGGPARWDFRSPLSGAKKFRWAAFRSASACWSTTADTSPSHCRCGVFLAAVSRADSSASVTYGRPASRACCRARSPSLNTTRAQPNAFPNAARCRGHGSRR
jgi:hypothetical protein